MTDIIHLLPDSVANQIAAGEVVQRPASVVKELVENSVDSGATSIHIVIKDAGRTLIQIVDNGCGMSGTDARMAFERHATSKIRKADDLFAIRTMGFRGEALASIAAVAEVVLQTRRHDDELGNRIEIAGSEVRSHDVVSCAVGSNFMVKNLFFNTPARRKFLKADTTEFRHVLNEFFRISLSNPGIAFSLMHNHTELYNLPPANFRQRIVHLFGKSFNQHLVQVNTETSITRVSGYVGSPDIARKTNSEQYFFVNNRYIRHPYLHRAVVQAFERLISPDQQPAYFICFEMDPASIDINIHPTKTEVKFEDERAIYQILLASVRESLGKHNVLPPLDFDTRGLVDIPVLSRHNGGFSEPGIEVNPGFNPFEPYTGPRGNSGVETIEHWEKLYQGFERDNHGEPPSIPGFKQKDESLYPLHPVSPTGLIQFKGKYILTPVKSGLMAIDQRRAHERVLYEKYLHDLSVQKGIAQQSIFPVTIDLEAGDEIVLAEILPEVNSLGYDLRPIGPRSYVINGYPADNPGVDPVQFLRDLIDEYREAGKSLALSRAERLAASLAKAAAIPYGKVLTAGEMRDLFDRLFACGSPNITPGGKTILAIIPTADIEQQF